MQYEIEDLGFDATIAVQNNMSEAQVREYFAVDVERLWPGTVDDEDYDLDALVDAALSRMRAIRERRQ